MTIQKLAAGAFAKRVNNGYPPGMVPVQVYVDADLKERLIVQAHRERVRPAEIVRAALEAELTRRGG